MAKVAETAAAPRDDDGATQARKWKRELQLATKRERDWFTDADKIVKRYRGDERRRNRFNILWTNTEILRPALYNSRPNPDVRRRFRDADPVGKAVSEILERSLAVFVDIDDTDEAMKNDVLDALLPGRGVSRIRYVPKIASVDPDATDEGETDVQGAEPSNGGDESPDGEPASFDDAEPQPKDEIPADEEIESEATMLEHVDWKDFRHGYGRVWPEVPWVAFRHKMNRVDSEEKFGKEAVAKVQFTVPEADEDRKAAEQVGETQKIAEFWEFWDKLGERVFFTQDAVEALLYPVDNPEGDAPLDFDGFFPCPRPLMIIENTGSMLPIPPFRLYEDAATQLEEITGRINKVVKGMKLRAVYDGRVAEMADLMAADDNDMIPTQSAQQWASGGLDKAITWMPVDKAAAVLEALYQARDKQKAIIDELTGIADIMRGATDPNETLGAQNLKATYGSGRLQRMQREVQRYAKDILRLAASCMSQKFSQATFEQMTELKFPTEQQKQMMIAQMRLAQAPPPMAPPPGQPPMPARPSPGAPPMGSGVPGQPPQGMPPSAPPAPNPLAILAKVPSWEAISAIMKSEKMRQYTIDVETDSTIASSLSSDMAGLSEVLKAVAGTMTELAPMVQSGVLPVDAAKELIMAVIRRSRLGMAVEDAFDKMNPPKPPPDPHAAEAAKIQAQGATDVHIANIKAQADSQLQQQRESSENQRMMMEEHFKQQREQFLEAQKTQRDETEARFDAMVKIIVATIGATKAPDQQVQPVADRIVSGNGAAAPV